MDIRRGTLPVRVAALAAGLAALAMISNACTAAPAQGDVPALQTQVAVKDKENADLKQQIAAKPAAPTAPEKANAILAAVPNAPPRATPTPRPANFTPAPAPQPPAASAVPVAFYVDTVTSGFGESQFNVDPSLSCVRNSAFKRGMHIVWRMKAVDTATGKEISRDDMQTATLKLPNGDTRNFGFGRHGADATSPWFWTAAWDVPLNYPLGSIDYSIDVVTKSGSKGTFKEIPVASAMLQVVD